MQGRLQGKRLTASHFLDAVVEHGAEACNYLLAIDVEMNTVGGYAMSSWERGYGDFEMKPDFDTLRCVPWHEGTALMPRRPRSGRRLARRRLAAPDPAPPARPARRARARGRRRHRARVHPLQDALRARPPHKGYRDLEPANLYNLDYSILGTSRVEPLIRRIRNEMAGAGLRGRGLQGRVQPRPARDQLRATGPALQTADEHSIYKNGAKEIADQEGMAITFMAKFDEREGSSCHIHLSLQREDGTPLFADDTQAFDRFLAGQLACMRELTLFFAPNINSYKRFADGSFAPTAVAWGEDNRTCSLRAVGHGAGAADRVARARAPTSTPTSRSPR